ncbi:MAG: class D beta-lactamase [Magnetococcales bacterium]|nr:class D beta-lactamase [Magnetococcales bacterium]
MQDQRFPHYYLLWLIIGLLFTTPFCQAEERHDPELKKILHKAGVNGCIVLLDVDLDQTHLSDETCSHEQFLPASTFKVANLLIALEMGVVQEDEWFPWDGTPLPIKAWEKNLTLKDAMAVSSVPVFQKIARRIGQKRMAEWVNKIGYGNVDIGHQVDRFWLDGPLAISPLEEAEFMARLAKSQLPFSKGSFEGLRRLMPQEDVGGAHFFGKTGWATAAKPMVGWYVGWVENHGKTMAFAVKILMESLEESSLRKSVAMDALRNSGILKPHGQQ